MTAASDYLENEIADHVLGTAAMTSPTNVYVQLHTADPGEAGTTAVATESTRKLVTFAAASGGVASSNSAASWTSVAGSETYSHFSIWDASTSGNCLIVGALGSPVAVTAGDNFEIASGDIDITVT